MRPLSRIPLLCMLLSSLCLCLPASAGYRIVQRDGSANLVGASKALVAPPRDDAAIIIRRIRVTNGSTTVKPSYRFFAVNTTAKEGDTTDLTSCSLPSCIEVLAMESVAEGTPYDYDGLNIPLMPGDRLFVHASGTIVTDSKYATFEVWYDEDTRRTPRR